MTRPFRAAQLLSFALAGLVLTGCNRDRQPSATDSTSQTGPQIAVPRETNDPEPVNVNGPARGGSGEMVGQGRDDVIAQAQQLAQQSRFAEASAKLNSLLVADPGDFQALFLKANIEAAAGNLADAIELLDAIPADHPEAGIPALGQSADWSLRLKRYDEAEKRYRQVLSQIPNAAPARRQLAFLLNCQGRRQEAAEQIRELCKLGDVRQDELHSLIVLNHAMYDDPNAPHDAGDVVYAPIGPSGVARKLFTDGKFNEAADLLHDLVESGQAAPSINAFYGRIVAEAQDDQRLLWWLAQSDERTREFADYWAALGTYLISQRRFEEATRALLEAADRDPTDMNSFGRLGQTLLTLGDEAASQRWLDRWDTMNESVKANNRISASSPPDPEAIADLAELLDQLNRPLEAVLWRSIAAHYRGTLKTESAQWNARRKELVASNGSFATPAERLCGVDLARFPLPKLDLPESPAPTSSSTARDRRPTPAAFVNVARSIGLDHAYQVAAQPQSEGFAIHQTYGGAVVVLDFDRDGRSDLYFAQGGSDPPQYRGAQTNRLYRNVAVSRTNVSLGDARLRDVSDHGGAADDRYSMGATAGDWNQDGFPDLVVSNIGEDSLFINNGDGTFTHRPIVAPNDQFRVPSSVAMADLTGDHIPDVFELSYVDDPMMIYRPKRNDKREVLNAMSPLQFDPGADRICENDGRGGMTIKTFTTETKDVRTGLGLVVTDFNDQPGNEIFVGNDLFPDHLWVRDQQTQAWSDVAQALGCAFGIRGSKTASMGIAAGDFDNTGTIDLHITNYHDRNASLFLNLGEAFLERNVQYGLAADSQSVLGFGTQSIDYDNDGDRDLVVTNGHIEKSLSIQDPYEQPAQLFANLGGRFQLVAVQDESGYWGDKHLGRGLARLDFNRDGRDDYAVTHLGETSALLINQTQTDHHWLQLVLVGTAAERDAIGAKITLRFDDRESTDWVIAGDGYFCKNESVVSFGLGSAETVDQIVVTWPTGKQQVFGSVAADRRLMLVEDDQEPFELH